MLTTLPEIDPLLEARLTSVARQLREAQLHRLGTFRWCAATIGGLILLATHAAGLISTHVGFVSAGALMLVAVFLNWRDTRRVPLDLEAAAKTLEARHPELQLALQTALEQRADAGQFTFLQRRVIRRALQHAEKHDWDVPVAPDVARWKRLHVAAICAAFLVLAAFPVFRKSLPSADTAGPRGGLRGITITPGNAEVERRSIVVITARYGGTLPKDVRLLWQTSPAETHTEAMAKSLSDPVFAFSLPPIETDTTYHLSHDEQTSATFKLTVYDLPALVRADATLTYPEYTGTPPRTIAETRRVSAVEGTELSYAFAFNKPLKSAILRETDGTEIVLTPSNTERTRFTTSFRLEKSHRFTLHLQDQQGRVNRTPEDIRIEAVPNKRPEVRLIAPVGDPRVSPIEEVSLRAEARDDFGLVDYGIAYSFGDADPEFNSSKHEPGRSIEAKFGEQLALETRKVEPGQLVTWFAWADDFGPDGKVRRTTGDLHFAEVRPLDEIFREDDSGGGAQSSQQGAGQQNQELIELQRQISIALWKLKQDPPSSPKRKEDLDTLQQSQQSGREQLEKASETLQEPRQHAAAEKAKRFMDRTLEELKKASASDDNRPLTPAWTTAQGAYQELLKMLPRETRVTQGNSRNGAGGKGGNQRQLNQLDFKQAENRYETETEAQPMTSPQQREQLQALAKLRELARRQQEVNQRLQELQTTLSAARDEAQREQVQRELKRLEEEQRRLLADTDELRERMDHLEPGEQTQRAREQLEQTREDMRRSGERLEKGEVSPALASGSRAAEGLDNLRENFRHESASQFSEQLREARKEVRELSEKHKSAEQKLDDLAKGSAHSLDDSDARDAVARSLEDEKAVREKLLTTLRQVAEDSEASEPGLHRRVYDLVRQQGHSEAGSQLQAGAEMLRHGFVPQAQDAVKSAGSDLQQLQAGVERAAESVLGDETAELRFAQSELDDLAKQLEKENRVSDNSGQKGSQSAGSATPPTPEERVKDGLARSEKPDSVVGGVDDPANDREQTKPTDSNRSPGLVVGGVDDAADNRGDTSKAGPSGRTESDVAGGGDPGDRTSQATGTDQTPGSAPPATTEPRQGARRGSGGRTGNVGLDRRGPMDTLVQELSNERGNNGGGGGGGNAPITGNGFNDWFERLRTVEELTQLPEAQQRLASARERAEALRRDFKRHAAEPQWALVESGIAAPLAQARVLLRQELARRENPEALQPVDRDPVPDKYAESVRQYYESLGR